MLSDAEARDRVARALEDLGSASFEVRERAREALDRWGGRARDLLEARREDPDPEVRRTVHVLLERLGGAAPAVLEPPPGDLAAIGLVTLDATGPLADVVRRLGLPHGATVDVPEPASAVPVRAALVRVPFFRALETVAGEAGLTAPGRFDTGGRIALLPRAGQAVVPWDAAGPFRVRLAEVTSVRTLGAEPGYRYALGLDLDWMPSVQVVTWSTPTDVQAVDDADRVYVPSAAMRTSTAWGASSTMTGGRVMVYLGPENPDDPALPAERLRQVAFKVPVRVRRDRASVTIDRPTADLPRELPAPSAGGAEGRVVLRALGRPEGEDGPWIADVAVRLVEETAQRSVEVWLVRADGTAQLAGVGSRTSASDGWTTLTARAWGRWEEPPASLRVAWFRLEEQGAVSFRLADVPLR